MEQGPSHDERPQSGRHLPIRRIVLCTLAAIGVGAAGTAIGYKYWAATGALLLGVFGVLTGGLGANAIAISYDSDRETNKAKRVMYVIGLGLLLAGYAIFFWIRTTLGYSR